MPIVARRPCAGRDRLALAALFLAALALRLAFRIDYDEDIDALRFRLGVERFSVTELRPHAPFYPVFVAAAKLVVLLGASSRGALGIVTALAGAVTVVVTALLAREVQGRRAAFVAGALALASPFLWLSSTKLLSDMAGVAAFSTALWLSARARRLPGDAAALRTAALVLLGVALGVRLSYFPLAAVCLVVIARAEGGGRAWLARSRDLLSGVVLWLVPLVAVAGPRALATMSLVQGEGHFTRWGGSALTVSSPSVRLHGAVWGLWANVLGGAWIDAPPSRWIGLPILAALLVLAASRARGLASRQPELALGAAAYLVWAVLAQNTAYKPRHFLPLAPLAVLALAAGEGILASRAPRAALVAALALAAQWLADGAGLSSAHRAPSPAAAAVAYLAGDPRPVLTRDLGRQIAEGAPGRAFVEVTDDASLVAAASRAGPAGVLLTSEALSPGSRAALAARGFSVRPAFARPRSRYVDSLWNELAVLELIPPG